MIQITIKWEITFSCHQTHLIDNNSGARRQPLRLTRRENTKTLTFQNSIATSYSTTEQTLVTQLRNLIRAGASLPFKGGLARIGNIPLKVSAEYWLSLWKWQINEFANTIWIWLSSKEDSRVSHRLSHGMDKVNNLKLYMYYQLVKDIWFRSLHKLLNQFFIDILHVQRHVSFEKITFSSLYFFGKIRLSLEKLWCDTWH